MNRFATAVLTSLVLLNGAHAQDKEIKITLTIDKAITKPTPVCVPLTLTPEQAKWASAGHVHTTTGRFVQVSKPGLLTERIQPASVQGVRRDFHFILNHGAAGSTMKLTFVPSPDGDFRHIDRFFWKDNGQFADLVFRGDGEKLRPMLRYMHKAYDDSSVENRNKTYKVFHHVFDPSGRRLVTNGGHTDENIKDPKKLLYPHHRGLQMGFNKTIYADGKKTADTWHCQKDDHQSHEGFLATEEGPFMARHRVAIHWHGAGKEIIVKEEREITVYNLPGGTMIDFASRLKPAGGKVKLDGDPQHAGFQFRAANEVADKTAKQTYYLRPDGKGKPGETRNWSPKDKTHANLPWDAMSFVVGGQRYTVCYLDQPRNPRESRWSERDYGRFGCYFEHELTQDRLLVLAYRIWLQEGEMTRDQVQALSDQFASPPKVGK